MRTFILIGKSRKTGKDEIILGREAKGSEHIATYRKLAASSVSEEYENVALIESEPFKRPLKFISKAAAEAKQSGKKSSAKKKAEQTETKTGTETGSNSDTQ
jgi:hypothetical protein